MDLCDGLARRAARAAGATGKAAGEAAAVEPVVMSNGRTHAAGVAKLAKIFGA